MTLVLTDSRIMMVPATLATLQTELAGDPALFGMLGVPSPPYWPPELNDADSFNHFIGMIEANPEALEWGAHYVLLVRPPRTLVASGGFIAPPDEHGCVEIGYSVLKPYRRQGIASALCKLLIKKAFADARVKAVKACTLPELTPSIGVLEKAGFAFTGEKEGTLTYMLNRA